MKRRKWRNKKGFTKCRDIGYCTDINAKCEYSKQRNDALLHYMFDGDKKVEFEFT